MSDVDQIDSEDDGLAYGYSGDEPETITQPEPETTETTEERAPTTEEAPEPEPEPEKPENTPAVTDEEPDKDSMIKRLDGRLRNMQGEINKLTKQITTQSTAAATAAAKEQGADAPTSTQVKEAMKDGEKMAAMRDEFPEWAAALDEQADSLEQRVLSKVKAPDVSGLATKEELALFEQTLPVIMKHPSFKRDINKPEFSEWFAAQAYDVKTLADSDEPADAISLMDKFYARNKAPALKPNPNQSRLEKSVAPSTGANKPPTTTLSEEDGMKVGYNTR